MLERQLNDLKTEPLEKEIRYLLAASVRLEHLDTTAPPPPPPTATATITIVQIARMGLASTGLHRTLLKTVGASPSPDAQHERRPLPLEKTELVNRGAENEEGARVVLPRLDIHGSGRIARVHRHRKRASAVVGGALYWWYLEDGTASHYASCWVR